jgi:hypothetical protein
VVHGLQDGGIMILQPRVRLSLTPEEGTLLERLADNPDGATRFTPAGHSRADYRAFNTDVVWPLEQLKRRGFVTITERQAAATGGAEVYWNAIVGVLTAAGQDAVHGQPRNSVGQFEVPEA